MLWMKEYQQTSKNYLKNQSTQWQAEGSELTTAQSKKGVLNFELAICHVSQQLYV